MRAVFADTFFWIAILNPDDSAHKEAREWFNYIGGAAFSHYR